MRKSSPDFTRWAINAISRWNNETRPENLFQIHGDKDHVFPIKKIKPDFQVRGGGHLMVLNMADLVSKEISNNVSGINS